MNKRSNAGRKPVLPGKKKKQVPVYVEQEIIDSFGGINEIREFLMFKITERIENRQKAAI
jgi:hypothetical protein